MSGGSWAARHGRAAVPFGAGTILDINGETATVMQLVPTERGNDVLVTDRGGARTYWIAARELLSSGRARIISSQEGPLSDDDVEVAGTVLANLTEQQRSKVAAKTGDVQEVLTGYRSGTTELKLSGEPRPEYAPDTSMTSRRCAKAAELGVHERTVRRWIDAYRAHGESGLASLCQTNPLGRTDGRWLEVAEEILTEYRDMSRPSRTAIMYQIEARLDSRFGVGVVPMPTRATAFRRLAQMDRRIPTFHGSRKRNREEAARPDREYGNLNPTRPGEYMVMDIHSLDIFVLDPFTLESVNAELTVSMDAYSRCITGVRVTPTTKSLDVAMTLYQTYRPNLAPAHWKDYAVWPEHGIPRAVFPDVDGLIGRTGASNPAILPDTIVVDHGKQFKCQHINSVCQRMGISIQPARLRTATDKGIVERFFLSLRLGLLQLLPGYKGPDVFSRGLHPEADATLFLDELEALIRQWIAEHYHHHPHEDLFDPNMPGHLFSPAQMFEHGVARAGYIEVPRDPDLAFEFLRPVRRQIRHDGVQYKNLIYNGPALNGLRGQESPHGGPADRKWYIYVNPDDLTRVYFRHPETRKWCTLLWKDAPSLDLPMSEDGLQYARRLAKARGTSTHPAAALKAMLAQWNMDLGRTLQERRIALRLGRERAALVGDLVTNDEQRAREFIEQLRAAESAASMTPESRPPAEDVDDDLDPFDDEDADIDLDDDTYYADAFDD
ncbi:Mu transposase C-terminal domain-containing protein [Mycobacterium sp. 48b]|uniref:Mu transposase C-terminal domain-containing protein n=1 Tax=Mycobacterium sp. 48b TaxID=3400426 RepID=UPI003AAA9167